jgi:hypothetical protein
VGIVSDGDGSDPGPAGAASADSSSGDEFGPRGWLLLAAIVVAFVVVPLVIYFRPPGVPFQFAYLVLPLVPAVLLALLAVWVTT